MAAALDTLVHHNPRAPLLPAIKLATCDRHPNQHLTGFCASCLRERLTCLDTAACRLNPSSVSSAAFRSLFSHHHPGGAVAAAGPSSSGATRLPQLRRCRSLSVAGVASRATAYEPQRRSCDVRERSTLWSLFHLADVDTAAGGCGVEKKPSDVFSVPTCYVGSANPREREVEMEPGGLGLVSPVHESRVKKEEEENHGDAGSLKPERSHIGGGVKGTWEVDDGQQLMPMKDHIDLYFQNKKSPTRHTTGGFWLAASVFGDKLRKWRQKRKAKKSGVGEPPEEGVGVAEAAIRKGRGSSQRLFRDARLEFADDAFGRRSCDTEPRFSLDGARLSFDGPGFSWDEPRASWDGYLVGWSSRQALPRLPRMLSVIEDAPIGSAISPIDRSDNQIPVEEDVIPGGTAQTRQYYSDSLSQRRRRSLDRSGSVGRHSAATDEPPLPTKAASISRVSPTAITNEYFYHDISRSEGANRDYKSRSLGDDCAGSFESIYGASLKGRGGAPKLSRRWIKAWSLWGLIRRRGGSSSSTVDANMVERSFSESWPELRRDQGRKFVRSSSSVSSRNSVGNINRSKGLGSMRRSRLVINGHGGSTRKEEFVLERNRSSRYSPSHVDNGLLRFYLMPLAGSRRSKGPGKGWHKNQHESGSSVVNMI